MLLQKNYVTQLQRYSDHKCTYVTLYMHDIKVFEFYAFTKKLCDTTVALL